MSDRQVRVTFAANVSGYVSNLRKAASETQRLGNIALDAQRDNGKHWDTMSSGLLKMGVGAAAALGMIGKAAVDWQSQWAGVQKTVDGTAAQMGVLEGQLRSMARSMPASHEQIAAVAEAAGQLGVAREQVASFTKTMIQLGETTNLSADEAATIIAQFTNIMGTSRDDVGRLSSALVELGNNGASTEKDIMELAHRLAGAGAMFNLSEAQVLGLGNAMASVGIEAEAGGTAMTLAFNQIDRAVREGGSGLETLARTAGMTGEQFKAAWSKDAAGATAAFIKGLGGVIKSGGDANKILDDLGMGGIRTADTMKRLASAGDLLTDSLQIGEEAWQNNSALIEEYAKRAETTEAKVQTAWNNIRDAGISMGQALLPIISDIATNLGYLASVFGSLPQPVQTAGVGILGLVATLGLVGGGAMKAVSALASAKAAVEALGWSLSSMTAKAGPIGIALAAIGVALGAFISKQAEAKQAANDYAEAMQGQTNAINENTRQVAVNHLEKDGLLQKGKQLGISAADLTDAALGEAEALGRVNKILGEASQTYEQYTGAQGETIVAKSSTAHIADELSKALGRENKGLKDGIENTKLRKEAMGEAGDATDQHSSATGENTAKIDENTRAIAENIAKQQEDINTRLGALNAEVGFAAALDKTKQITAELGSVNIDTAGSIDVSTEAGRKFATQIADLSDKADRNAEAMAKNKAGASAIEEAQARARQACYDAALAMTGNAQAAQALTDKYFAMPNDIYTRIHAPGVFESEQAADEFYDSLMRLPEDKQTEIISKLDRSGVDAAKAALNEVQDKDVTIRTRMLTTQEIQQIVNAPSSPVYRGRIHGNATGGYISGPGTGTSDSIPAWLSNGEYVIKAASVRKLGLARLNHMNATGNVPRFASGGYVGPTRWAPQATGGGTIINLTVNPVVPNAEIGQIAANEIGRMLEKRGA